MALARGGKPFRNGVSLLLFLLLAVVRGQPAFAQTWGELEVPGGVTAAREVLGLGGQTRTPAAFLADVVRTHHQFGDIDSKSIEAFEGYFTFVQSLRSALATWPDGLTLGNARLPRPVRDRWRDLAELLALRLREVKNRPVLEPARGDDADRRRGWLQALGIDPRSVAERLNRGERVDIVIPSDIVPLPVPGLWSVLLGKNDRRPDVVRIGASHRHALLYIALLSMDDETLRYVEAHPDLLDLDVQQAGVLAAFSRSIRIRGNAVVVAGADVMAPVWLDILDRRIDEPVRFIRRLLERDEGRTAFFYDTIARMTSPVREALLEGARNTRDRREALERHYRWFRDVDPAWRVGTRPFFRPDFDPSLAYDLLDIAPDGSVGPAWWPQILQRITDDDGWPDRAIRNLEDRGAGLAWAMAWLFEKGDGLQRFQLLRFAQRRFAATPKAQAAQVEVALRGFHRMPALHQSLERLGVDDVALHAGMAEAAHRLTEAGDYDEVGPNLLQWQAALAVMEQALRRRSLPAAHRDQVLAALAKAVPESGARLLGNLGVWIVDHLLPAFGVDAPVEEGYERQVITAWLVDQGTTLPTLSWEGLDYRVDRAGPAARDAAAVRAVAKGPTLADVVRLVAVRRELEAGLTSLDQAKALATRLSAIARTFATLRDEQNKPLYDTGDLEDAARTLARIRRPRDLNRASRQVPRVLAATAMATHHVLPALAYALAAAPTQQPALFADRALRHALAGARDRASSAWRHTVWRLPTMTELETGGSGIVGSMVGLDVTLADTQLRRLAVADAAAPPPGDTANVPDRDAFVHRLVLPPPAGTLSAASEAVVTALAAGGRRIAELGEAVGGGSAGRDAAREALLSAATGELRANLAVWLWERKQKEAVAEMLLPTERFHLGSDQPLPAELGLSSLAFDGCLCSRAPLRRGVVDWLGRGSSGHLSVLVVDLQVRVLEALTELRLPAFLMELVLPMAIQDALDRAGQYGPGDWEALAVARFLPRERVEEYLLALVAEGVLAPPRESGKGGR